MGIMDLFKKKTQPKTMTLQEQLKAGLITYDEAQDENACEFVKSYLRFVGGRRTSDSMIISMAAGALASKEALLRDIKRGAGISELREMTYQTSSTLHSVDSIKRENHVTNIASFEHGSFTLECARATSEIALGIKELDFNDFVDRCMKPEVVESARKEVGTYIFISLGNCPMPEFSRKDLESFIGAILVMEDNVDHKRAIFNENLYLLDDEGNLAERDNLVYFKDYDLDILEEAKKNGQETYDSLLKNHHYDAKAALLMMVEDIDEGISKFKDLTKKANEAEVFYDIMYARVLRKEYLRNNRYNYDAFKEGYPEISNNTLVLECGKRGCLLDDITSYLNMLDEYSQQKDAFWGSELKLENVDIQ